MAGCWPCSFFWGGEGGRGGGHVYGPSGDSKHPNKELGQYPAILTSCLANNPYVQLFFKVTTKIHNTVDALLATTLVSDQL